MTLGVNGNFIGLISDTHGLMRRSALQALEGADKIVHAGDIDNPEILDQLKTLAPVVAVRGNMDRHADLKSLPLYDVLGIEDQFLCVIHDLGALDFDPHAAGFSAVISGHTHRPSIEQKNGVLYINPGSAGPRRFKLPVTVGILKMGRGGLNFRVIELEDQ